MKLHLLSQHPKGHWRENYDLVVVASGYETRSRYVAEQLIKQGINVGQKVVLSFIEHTEDCARPDNDKFFANNGYRRLDCKGRDSESVYAFCYEALSSLKESDIANVLVDISSMTRAWYGAVVKALTRSKKQTDIIVDFSYTPAHFVEPSEEYPPNRVLGPVSGFRGNALPDKPSALIIGLGYDRDRALGLKDSLDPQLTLVFCADPSPDERFVQRVAEVNHSLLEESPQEQQFKYPLLDFVTTFRTLESVCNGLCKDWRVVLCSLGPKVFGLACFLLASHRREISIWRVGADDHEQPYDQQPAGDPMVIATEWIQESSDEAFE